MITCDENIDAKERKTISTNFNEKNAICETKKLYILLFLLTAVALLIAVSIYCYQIKYKAKKYLLPFHDTAN